MFSQLDKIAEHIVTIEEVCLSTTHNVIQKSVSMIKAEMFINSM